MLFRGRGAPGRGWAEESEAPVTSGRDRDLPGASPSVPPRDGERVCRGRPAADALLLGGAVSGILALILAAGAEEVFFRRFLYGWLAVRGAAPAVVGSAVLFAAVHLPAYGPAALPVDLAAGLLLGWQRWAAGTWTAPAATHALANLLQLR